MHSRKLVCNFIVGWFFNSSTIDVLLHVTGAPLIIHPGRNERAPFEILDILEASGADISHTVMSHLDRTFYDNAVLLEFAKRGCYLEYDVFGIECSHNQVIYFHSHVIS